ncbi:MAG: hypothetical protein KAW12_00330 [Candidatus Aminicenantes bacterium]|nr:hypothetical protein [Candidatus Aminicenantes bacterium]
MKYLTTILSILIPVVLALCGYLYTYFSGKKQEQRKNRLERINRQLDDFYGPLLAIVQSSQQAWENFIRKYDDNPDFYKQEHNPSPEQVAEFHNWMKTVFLPNNEKLHEIIVNNTSLLIEDKMPKILLDLMAHIMEFRINFEARKDKHAEVAESRSKYRGQPLLKYCEKRFKELKTEQLELIKGR